MGLRVGTLDGPLSAASRPHFASEESLKTQFAFFKLIFVRPTIVLDLRTFLGWNDVSLKY